MIAAKLSLLLATAATVHGGETRGYLIDNQCIINLCGESFLNNPAGCTPDQTNPFYNPEDHTGWCLKLGLCVQNKYAIMSEFPDRSGNHLPVLNLTGAAAHANALAYIDSTNPMQLTALTKTAFPLVKVVYDDADMTEGEGAMGPLAALSDVTIMDPWSETDPVYSGAATTQTICDKASDASMDNNMCFRSDVQVSMNQAKSMVTIESNACPDHENFSGGSGQKVIPNDQSKPTAPPAGGNAVDPCAANPCAANPCAANPCAANPCAANPCAANPCAANPCAANPCAANPCAAGACGGSTSTPASTNIGPNDPLFQHYTMMIPDTTGEPGAAKKVEGDVVGIMLNGVILDVHEETWAYDLCNGHSDTKHQYHYHIPPICYLKTMGVPVPDSDSWWMNDAGDAVRSYDTMHEQFPATGSSPVVGWARDGFPIYAVYGPDGNLQRSQVYGGDLDECNGKSTNGSYAYYLTAEPPFVPTCLKGEVGSFAYAPTTKACPKGGISNTVKTADGAPADGAPADGAPAPAPAPTPDTSGAFGSLPYFSALLAIAAATVASFV